VAPVEYAVAVDEYLGQAELGAASRRVYRISLTGWTWPLVGKPIPEELLKIAPGAIQAPAKLELELAELSDEDKEMFMQEMNLKDLSKDETLRNIFHGMNQIVFFTVGEDECRAWAIPKGSTSPQGAGQIHTDLGRGFVRAEVVSYDDFKKHGSMKEAKQHGVYRLEGKTYVVKDGDIMHILAST